MSSLSFTIKYGRILKRVHVAETPQNHKDSKKQEILEFHEEEKLRNDRGTQLRGREHQKRMHAQRCTQFDS